MRRFATAIVRHRRAVLVASILVLLASFAYGGKVTEKLNNGGFADPSSPSSKATDLLEHQFHTGPPNLVLVVSAHTGSVDRPDAATEGMALTTQLTHTAGVEGTVSYWSLGRVPPLRSTDGTKALILARLTGSDDQVNKRVHELEPSLIGSHGPLSVAVTGQAAVFRQVGDTIRHDLAKAEAIAIPITAVLLMFLFGSVVASFLPLAIGGLAVGGTFATLTALVSFTHVSIFSLNLTTALGMALAVDYSLFVVYRFREELRRGHPTEEAVVRTMQTAGRTVLFSASTVAASLAALLIFPLYFLRSFAYAGIAVVTIAAAGAVVVLPALLATLGPRVDALDLRRVLLRRPAHVPEVGEGFWHRLATFVMRRPAPIAAAIVVVLVLLGSPFLRVHFGQPDERVLPTAASTRSTATVLQHDFSSGEANALAVVAPHAEPPAATTLYAEALSRLPNVARVDSSTGSFIHGTQVAPGSPRFTSTAGTWLSVVPLSTLQPQSTEGEHLVHLIRNVASPGPTLVGGSSAQLVDAKKAIFARVPWALGIVAAVTLVTLFLMFGSLLVPAKAVVLNLLSLTATFGAMVWVFQEGHASRFLNFTATGTLDTSMPILMFCIAFGLSMDYEVFLLSRIKEEHDGGASTEASVAVGLERTGRLVTAAAALLAVVFIAFATSSVTFIKLFGLGLTLAVLMDATLVRGLLVPAFMRLAGNANWWAPRPMRRIYERWGITETSEPQPPPILDLEPVAAR